MAGGHLQNAWSMAPAKTTKHLGFGPRMVLEQRGTQGYWAGAREASPKQVLTPKMHPITPKICKEYIRISMAAKSMKRAPIDARTAALVHKRLQQPSRFTRSTTRMPSDPRACIAKGKRPADSAWRVGTGRHAGVERPCPVRRQKGQSPNKRVRRKTPRSMHARRIALRTA